MQKKIRVSGIFFRKLLAEAQIVVRIRGIPPVGVDLAVVWIEVDARHTAVGPARPILPGLILFTDNFYENYLSSPRAKIVILTRSSTGDTAGFLFEAFRKKAEIFTKAGQAVSFRLANRYPAKAGPVVLAGFIIKNFGEI